jgi:hypothetical protein
VGSTSAIDLPRFVADLLCGRAPGAAVRRVSAFAFRTGGLKIKNYQKPFLFANLF